MLLIHELLAGMALQVLGVAMTNLKAFGQLSFE